MTDPLNIKIYSNNAAICWKNAKLQVSPQKRLLEVLSNTCMGFNRYEDLNFCIIEGLFYIGGEGGNLATQKERREKLKKVGTDCLAIHPTPAVGFEKCFSNNMAGIGEKANLLLSGIFGSRALETDIGRALSPARSMTYPQMMEKNSKDSENLFYRIFRIDLFHNLGASRGTKALSEAKKAIKKTGGIPSGGLRGHDGRKARQFSELPRPGWSWRG